MSIDIEILKKLMDEIEQKIDLLLESVEKQNNKINLLQHENKQLKDNYFKIINQINLYIDELEEIKLLNSKLR